MQFTRSRNSTHIHTFPKFGFVLKEKGVGIEVFVPVILILTQACIAEENTVFFNPTFSSMYFSHQCLHFIMFVSEKINSVSLKALLSPVFHEFMHVSIQEDSMCGTIRINANVQTKIIPDCHKVQRYHNQIYHILHLKAVKIQCFWYSYGRIKCTIHLQLILNNCQLF